VRLLELARVRVQNPLRLSDQSESVADIAVVERRRYDSAHPVPHDVFLVIEVSDSSLRFDLAAKVPMYALAGIPEVWIVDIARSEVHIFRSPAEGNFLDMHIGRAGEVVAPLKFPDVQIDLGAVFH
jgi:Uma2 family endonuclease